MKIQRTSDGIRAVFRNWSTMLVGSGIGTFIGAVPGVGGTVAAFLSYSTQVQRDGNPDPPYGTGNIRGVIAPESANNAKDGGSLIPTLAFGIPGSAETAVFLGAMILHGLEPGPTLLKEHTDEIYTLVLDDESPWKGVPTAAAIGHPELTSLATERMVGAPPGTPRAIATVLEQALVKGGNDPSIQAWAKKGHRPLSPTTAAATDRRVDQLIKFYTKYKGVLAAK